MSSIDKEMFETIPVFNLQQDHDRVSVPTDFDMRDLARKHMVFPLRTVTHNQQDSLVLAMVNPFDHAAVAEVESRSGIPVIPVRSDKEDVKWLIQVHFYGLKLSPVAKTEGQTDDWFGRLTAHSSQQIRS